MSTQKKLLIRGLVMLICFFAVLAAVFSPIFPGKINGLVYMDNLFNMISKGSSYFIPTVTQEAESYKGNDITVSFALSSEEQAEQTAFLFKASGVKVKMSGNTLTVNGDMGQILLNSLNDADFLFKNEADPLKEKYGYDGKHVLFNWWSASKGIISDLNKQKKFREAKTFATLQKKAFEPAFNYYGVEEGNYKDNFVLIIASLLFYVVYTLWYGFGIMYLFEGIGLRIAH